MGFINVLNTADKIITVAKPIFEEISEKIQPEMKQFAEQLFILSQKYPDIEKAAIIIDKMADLLGEMLVIIGMQKEDANMLGLKIVLSEKSVEEFQSIEEYVNYLKKDVVIEQSKYEKITEVEVFTYTIIGIALEVSLIAEKLGISISADIMWLIGKTIEMGNVMMDASGIIDFFNAIKDNGKISLQEVYEYFVGEGLSDRIKTGNILKDIMESLYPDNSSEIIEKLKNSARG